MKETKGPKISWGNCCGRIILLTQPYFSILSMKFTNMLEIWFYGDISKNVPPYRILRPKDGRPVNCGNQKLTNMKFLVRQVIRAAEISNRHDLVFRNWSSRKLMDLYLVFRNFFGFPFLSSDKRRHNETIPWETYFNALSKRKGKLFGYQ